jgi:hypothetical protein
MSNRDQGGRPVDALNQNRIGYPAVLDVIRFGREGVDAYIAENPVERDANENRNG